MKLWVKIYIITLALFLVLINIGFFSVFNMTYNKDIKSEKSIAQTTFEMINSSLIKSIDTMYTDDRLDDESLLALMEITEQYYEKQDIDIMFYADDRIIYSKDDIEKNDALFSYDKMLMTKTMEEDVLVIYTTVCYDAYDENYYLCCRKPLYELHDTWEELQKKYLIMSAVCSAVLATLLFIILKRLMKPIEELSKAVKRVKQDGYDIPSHVSIKGNDDIAKLGENFNEMSDIIAENIKKMRMENHNKQQFVDNFAHELKSPLTSIYGFAEYVAKANIPDAEKEECMQFIMGESSRMLEMAYNLMDLSEIRNKEIDKDYFDAQEFKTELETMLKEKLIQRNVELDFDINVSRIFGNEGLVKSLIGNIIANGINASQSGSKINICFTRENDINKFVITDYGCGMSEDELQHIFEPFYRADKARSRRNGSTGLGLSVCKQIADAHNGSIQFESKKGIGTKVTILLPAK